MYTYNMHIVHNLRYKCCVIRNAPIYENATYEKTDHPVYETVISRGSELGADVQLQENPLYGIVVAIATNYISIATVK